MNVEMLQLGATYYHVTRRDEIEKFHIIGGRVSEEADLSDSATKNTYPPDLSIERLFPHGLHRVWRRRHPEPHRPFLPSPLNKVVKSLTNHKTASKFVLINMVAVIHIAKC